MLMVCIPSRYLPKLLDGLLDESLAMGFAANVPDHLHSLRTGPLDAGRFLGVLFFLFKVEDEYICALPGEGNGDRARCRNPRRS